MINDGLGSRGQNSGQIGNVLYTFFFAKVYRINWIYHVISCDISMGIAVVYQALVTANVD